MLRNINFPFIVFLIPGHSKIKLSLVIDNIIFPWIIGIMLKEYGIFKFLAVSSF